MREKQIIWKRRVGGVETLWHASYGQFNLYVTFDGKYRAWAVRKNLDGSVIASGKVSRKSTIVDCKFIAIAAADAYAHQRIPKGREFVTSPAVYRGNIVNNTPYGGRP